MTCSLCLPTPHEILWQDDFCRVVLLNDTDYPAYCRIELIAHVKEMTDLDSLSQLKLMKIVFAVEAAMREVVKPDKINLASLGNKTPHLHWHLIPRFVDDKHFPNSHWGEMVRGEANNATLQATNNQIHRHVLSRHVKTMFIDKVKAHVECALQD